MRGYFCIGFIGYILAGKTLIDYINLFSPHDFKKNGKTILDHMKMDEAPSMHPNLRHQTQFRLDKINKIKDYFITEIREREARSKRLTKNIAVFGYTDKTLIVLSATSDSVSIASFASVIGVLVVIACASFSFAFS